MNIADLTATLNLRDNLSPALLNVSRNVNAVGVAMGKVAAQWLTAGDRMKQVGQEMALNVTAPMVAAGAGALKFSTDFTAAMTKTVTIAGESAANLAVMKKAVLDLAPTVGIGPTPLAEALLVVQSTGMAGAASLNVLERSAKASAIGLGEAKDFARAVTAAMTAYGAENLSAAQASDVLYAAVRAGGGEADEFANTLGRVIGTAREVGVSFQEVATNIATFTRLGVDSSEAVTALNGTLGVLLKPSKEAREQLEALGSSMEELRKSVREKGLTEAMIDLVTLTRGNDDAIGAIVPNVRALAGVLGTAGAQADKMREVFDAVKHSTGALDQAFTVTAETGAFKWSQFQAKLSTVAIAFGDELAPHALAALKALQPLLDLALAGARAFGDLPRPIQTAGLALAGVVAAAGPVTYMLGTTIRAVGGLSTAMSWFIASSGGQAVKNMLLNLADVILPSLARSYGTTTTAANTFRLAAIGGLSVALLGAGAAAAYAYHEVDQLNTKLETSIAHSKESADILAKLKAQGFLGAGGGGELGIDSLFGARRAALQALANQTAPIKLAGLGISVADAQAGFTGGATAQAAAAAAAFKAAVKDLQAAHVKLRTDVDVFAVFQGLDVSKMAPKYRKDFLGLLDDMIDGYGSLEAAGRSNLRGVYDALDRVVGKTYEMHTAFAGLVHTNVPSWMGDLGRSGAPALPRNLLPTLADTIGGVSWLLPNFGTLGKSDASVTIPKPPSEWGVFGASMSASLQQLGPTVMAALTGGGNVGNAVGGMFGSSIGTQLSKQFGERISLKLGDTLGGALSNALPGIGALIGPLVGKAFGAISGVFTGGEGAKANDLRDALKLQMGGDAKGSGMAAIVGQFNGLANVQQAYNAFMSGGSREKVQAAFDTLKTSMDAAQAMMTKYGLSLDDLKTPSARASSALGALAKDYLDLKKIGFTDDKLGSSMAAGLNEAIRAAKESQVKIPAALGPVLETFVRGGNLSQDLARTLLGIPEQAKVPWREMKTIAEEFNIAQVALGDGFRNAQLVEGATSLAEKWHILVDNGANVGAVIEGMKTQANEALQNFMAWGIEIPASMRGMFDAMQRAGALTDLAGNKLENLDGLNFGVDLTDRVGDLVAAVRDLVETLGGAKNGFNDAASAAANFKRHTQELPADWNGGGFTPGDGDETSPTPGHNTKPRGGAESTVRPRSMSVSTRGLRAVADAGGSATTVHLTINAIDGPSVRRFVESPDFKRAFKTALRDNRGGFGEEIVPEITRRQGRRGAAL